MGGFGDDLLRLEGIKLMPDGGVGDRTARMFEPYLDEPDNRGQWVVEPGKLAEMIRWVHDLGWSMDIHTCGDEAQEFVVRDYARRRRSGRTRACATGCTTPISRPRTRCD